MMKKLLIAFGVLCLLALLVSSIFVATFNADRYRPLLVDEIQKALGKPVRIEHLSLGFHDGLALELRGFTIAEGGMTESEPLIQVELASARVHLMPLLRKEVHVSSVLLKRPRVHIARDAQGKVNLLGLAVAASPAAAAHPSASGGTTAVSVNVGSLVLQDGALHWTDDASTPRTDLWVRALDVTVTHLVPGEPMMLDVKGAFAGQAPNVSLLGRLTPPNQTTPGSVEQLRLSIERVPLGALLPPARPGEPELRGKLTLTLQGRVPTLDPAQLVRS